MKLTNTLSGKLQDVVSIDDNDITLYVCGITPYDYAHVGHGRAYVTFDLLYRLLSFLGYDVTYCRNFTDIDDKIIARALKELGDQQRYPVITKKYIDAYTQDMQALNCLPPTHEPSVTQNIPAIISFIQDLIDKGHAYVVNGDVYFSILTFNTYGKLSKQKIADLHSGERVQIDTKKRDPLDFALWKSESTGQFFKSPWGYGRPGWHIECSALAHKYLGETIDIHGGGRDLIFPHHENEIAQSEARFSKPFVRLWVHNGFVQVNKEKMSKSLGNFFTLKDVFEKFDPMVVRYYFLTHHYRAPLEFNFEGLAAVQKSYQRLCKIFTSECPELTQKQILASPIASKMITFLQDDLNTPGMLGVVFENLTTLEQDETQRCAVAFVLRTILGLSLKPVLHDEPDITEEIQILIDKREIARQQKDWKTADALRERLEQLGYAPQDKKVS